MKKEKKTEKLNVKKHTITQLNQNEMNAVKGGSVTSTAICDTIILTITITIRTR